MSTIRMPPKISYDSNDWIEIGLVGFGYHGLDADILHGINRYRSAHPSWILRDAGHQHFLLTNLLRNPKLAGVFANVTDPKRMEILRAWGGPVIDLSGTIPDCPFPQISVQPGSIGQLGAAHLHQLGHTRIVFVSGVEWTFELDRWQGVRNYCQHHDLQAWWWIWSDAHCADCVHADPIPSPPGRNGDARHAFLSKIQTPVALFTAMDRIGSQLADACRLHSLRIPEDVALLGVDNNLHICESCTPPLSSIRLPGEEMGKTAAEHLYFLMNNNEVPHFTRLPPLDVFERESTRIKNI
jgi:LacI family transcriptional regulator